MYSELGFKEVIVTDDLNQYDFAPALVHYGKASKENIAGDISGSVRLWGTKLNKEKCFITIDDVRLRDEIYYYITSSKLGAKCIQTAI